MSPRDWLETLSTVVSRKRYLETVRALHDARAAYYDERAECANLHGVLAHLQNDINRLTAERTQIRSVLLALPVYEGLAAPAPLGMLVSELARDHSVLTERIESVLDLILARRDMDHIDPQGEEMATLNTIAGLLQGQITNVPNTVEGLD